MGMPNPEQLPQQIQQQVQQTTHVTYGLAHDILWWLEHHLGAWTILICLITGLAVWVLIIFRREIKKRFGELIKLADSFVNRG